MTRFVWQEAEVEGWPCGMALVSLRLCACCHVVHLLLSCLICLSTEDPAGFKTLHTQACIICHCKCELLLVLLLPTVCTILLSEQ